LTANLSCETFVTFYIAVMMGKAIAKHLQNICLLFTCLIVMEFHFDVILCSSLVNENSDVGHIKCSRGPQVPHPCRRLRYFDKRR